MDLRPALFNRDPADLAPVELVVEVPGTDGIDLVATTIRSRQLERGAVIGVARLADVPTELRGRITERRSCG
ncbi:hypothetical protein [Streptomyces sp. NPDC058240]|uniref:hypothetical protein n=1 Tax=Streptomyces sp. NPDC058240 TaxID=3346396 RepID=UPI0036E9299D